LEGTSLVRRFSFANSNYLPLFGVLTKKTNEKFIHSNEQTAKYSNEPSKAWVVYLYFQYQMALKKRLSLKVQMQYFSIPTSCEKKKKKPFLSEIITLQMDATNYFSLFPNESSAAAGTLMIYIGNSPHLVYALYCTCLRCLVKFPNNYISKA
jgi:hypothetical protein